MRQKLRSLSQEYKLHEVDYDSVYDFLEGWTAYAKNANTYKLRRKISTAIKDGLVCSKPISFLSNGRDNIYYIMEKEYFIVYTKTDCYYCKNIESEELFISLIDCYKLNCKDWIKMDNIKIKMEEVIVCF